MTIENWIKEHNIPVEDQIDELYVIKGQIYKYLPEQTLSIKDKQLELDLDKETIHQVIKQEIHYFLYEFGGKLYMTPSSNVIDLKLTPFRINGYEPFTSTSHLGIHGRYEIMNGTRDYPDWCARAKELGYNALGLAELHTLGGTLAFQLACDKAEIKPIIGMSIMVEATSTRYKVNMYAQSEKAWKSLLRVNKHINVDNEGLIDEKSFLALMNDSDLIIAIEPHKGFNKVKMNKFKDSCETYYKINTNEHYSSSREKEVLDNMQLYLNNHQDILDPILINDSYVIDKQDTEIKETLNKGGQSNFGNQTKNHYFRSIDESFLELAELFNEDDDRLMELFSKCLTSLERFDQIDWKIATDKMYLPVYEMTDEESDHHDTNRDLFLHLLEEGAYKVDHHDQQVIKDRIAEELDIIERGGFIDYFLILWDIINWSEEQKIQVGPARGSSAGSLCCYLLGITKIDPIEYDLLFVRFLNEGRLGTPIKLPDGSTKYVGGELPDIDTDFASDRRDEVLDYMKNRYGYDYFCQVGTYGALQVRGVIKELARHYGVRGNYIINVVTKFISPKTTTWEGIFKDAITSKLLREFIQDNPRIINGAKIALNSIKSTGIHACATILVPKLEGINGIYDLIPVTKVGDVLVSQWEGGFLDKVGFLKEDILSTKQMSKIGSIIDLIEENSGVRIDTRTIPTKDEDVFQLFREGRCQDVFQFGTTGLTAYMKHMQPTDIEDLIAATALYRPGPMASDAHNDYVRLKQGEIEPEYHYMLEEVTKKTFSLIIYQEQIIKAAQVLGGMTPLEAEGVRKATGKKDLKKMISLGGQFKEGAINNGCSKEEVDILWDKIVAFSGYSFNRSHAASYSLIGYWCNWFKLHHPLEFWTVAFQFIKDEDVADYVAEIRRVGKISIENPDINKSGLDFYSSVEEQKIYWNLSQIKFVGAKAAEDIITERTENGDYYDIEEFVERTGSAVNRRVVENLIMSGAFDKMYLVDKPSDRFRIMQKYYATRKKEEFPQQYVDNCVVDYYWSIKQQEISKLSDINYLKLIKSSNMRKSLPQYVDSEEYNQHDISNKKVALICGMVTDIQSKKTKRGDPYAVITIQQDEYTMHVRAWKEALDHSDPRLESFAQMVEEQKRPLCIFRGYLAYNDFTKTNELTMNTRLDKNIFEIFSI